MTKKIKGLGGAIILFIMIGSALLSCSDDIIVEAPLSLLGEYEGRYRVVTNFNLDNQQTEEFQITWRFSDKNYWIYSLEDGLCSPSGSYTYESEVGLEQLFEGCSGTIGNPDDNPTGVFSIRQPGDSVILTQIEDVTKKEILLTKSE